MGVVDGLIGAAVSWAIQNADKFTKKKKKKKKLRFVGYRRRRKPPQKGYEWFKGTGKPKGKCWEKVFTEK